MNDLLEKIPGDVVEISSAKQENHTIRHTVRYMDTTTGELKHGTWVQYEMENTTGWDNNERTTQITVFDRVA